MNVSPHVSQVRSGMVARAGDLPDAAAQLGARQWQSVRVRRYWAAMSQENVGVVHATYEQIPGLAAAKEAEA